MVITLSFLGLEGPFLWKIAMITSTAHSTEERRKVTVVILLSFSGVERQTSSYLECMP